MYTKNSAALGDLHIAQRSPNYHIMRQAAIRSGNRQMLEFYASDLLIGSANRLSPAQCNGYEPEVGPSGPCIARPRKCDCHVIGGTTLGTEGIPTTSQAARITTLSIDAGDADAFVPYYIYFVAYQVAGGAPTEQITGVELPLLLMDSRSGQNPNLRRASDTDPSFGIITTVYGDEKELECVDWRTFGSINNQQLSLLLYNPNDVTVHAFVDIWGIPVAA